MESSAAGKACARLNLVVDLRRELRVVGVGGLRGACALAAMRKVLRGPGPRRYAQLFSPLAGGRHVHRAVIDVRRNVMRVGLSDGTRGRDCDERCAFMARRASDANYRNRSSLSETQPEPAGAKPPGFHLISKQPANDRCGIAVPGIAGPD